MKRRELHILYTRVLRSEATETEVAAVRALRAESPEQEAEYQSLSKTFRGLTEVLGGEELEPPGAPFENEIMRRIRAEDEANRGWRGFLREFKHHAVLVLGICTLAAGFLVPLGPSVHREQRYFSNQMVLPHNPAEPGTSDVGSSIFGWINDFGIMLTCGFLGVAMILAGASGRTRSSRSMMIVGFGLVVFAVRILVFEVVLSDFLSLKVFE